MNTTAPANYEQHKQQLLADPATSFALRSRIEQDAKRDPVDALSDAQALFDLQTSRYAEIVLANDPHKTSEG